MWPMQLDVLNRTSLARMALSVAISIFSIFQCACAFAATQLEQPSEMPAAPALSATSGTQDAFLHDLSALKEELQREIEMERNLQKALDDPRWKHGPILVQLKGPTSLQVPEGFKFLSEVDRAHFKDALEVIVAGDGALIASESDDELIIVDAMQLGHVGPTRLIINPRDALEKLSAYNREWLVRIPRDGSIPDRNQSNASWTHEPVLDVKAKTLVWGYLLPDRSEKMEALSLGRTWFAMFSAAPGLDSDKRAATLDTLSRNVVFSTGERYADAIEGDPIPSISLDELIAGPPSAQYQMIQRAAAVQQHETTTVDPRLLRVLFPVIPLILGLIVAALRGAGRESANEAHQEQGKPD